MTIVRGLPPAVQHPLWDRWSQRSYTEDIAPYGVDEELHHYVRSEKALLSILTSQTLWASDARCLNDSTEFEHGIPMCFDALGAIRDRRLVEHVEIVKSGLRERFRYQTFIACLSRSPDIQGQWERYADHQQGFAVTFDNLWLSAVRDVRLMPVEYDRAKQRNRAERAVTRAVQDIEATPAPTELHFVYTVQSRFTFLAVELFFLCTTFKSFDWSVEQEWRIIHTRHYDETGGMAVRYRENDGRTIPFLELDLTNTYVTHPPPLVTKVHGGPKIDSVVASRVEEHLAKNLPSTAWLRHPPFG